MKTITGPVPKMIKKVNFNVMDSGMKNVIRKAGISHSRALTAASFSIMLNILPLSV